MSKALCVDTVHDKKYLDIENKGKGGVRQSALLILFNQNASFMPLEALLDYYIKCKRYVLKMCAPRTHFCSAP